MNFQQANIYIFSDDQIDTFLERLKDNKLEKKDHKFIMYILKSYQSFFQDFIFGNMSKAQFRKKIEKLMRDHGEQFPETPNGDNKNDKNDDDKTSKPDKSDKQATPSDGPKDNPLAEANSSSTDSDVSASSEDKKDKVGRNLPNQENRNNHGQRPGEGFSHAFSVFHGIEDLNPGDKDR